MGRGFFIFISLLGTMILAAIPAAWAADQLLGEFSSWKAHSYGIEGTTVCNMWSRPTKDEGNYTRRGDIYAFVLNRPADQRKGEISFEMGYPLKKNSRVKVSIGSQKFELFTEGGTAFAWPEDEPQLIRAMRAGSIMIVKGISTRGTQTTDTYSLKGFTAANNAINRACR